MKARIAAGVVAIAAVVLVAALVLGGGSESGDSTEDEGPTTTAVLADLIGAAGFGNPNDVEFPPVADDGTISWLEGDGAVAVELVNSTEQLWASGMAACEVTAAALDSLGSPEEIAAAAAGTPDDPTQEVLLGLYTATGTALSACTDESAFEDARAKLAWQWAITDRRLSELGIAR